MLAWTRPKTASVSMLAWTLVPKSTLKTASMQTLA
jgi:hypothetical protein